MNDNQKKWAYFLPNSFTALNMGCGFMAIIEAHKGDFYHACLLLILGAIFDSVDGRIARMTGTQSSFGEQFDSLSDLLSFGLAPGLIFYLRFLDGYGRIGLFIAFIFVLCGALRLARFNANIDKVSSSYFQGLPIPAGATSMIGYILLTIEFPALLEVRFIAIPYALFYSFLMISNIPFPSFKKSDWIKGHKKESLLIVFIVMASIAAYVEVMAFAFLTVYVVLSLVYFLKNREKFINIFKFPIDEESHG